MPTYGPIILTGQSKPIIFCYGTFQKTLYLWALAGPNTASHYLKPELCPNYKLQAIKLLWVELLSWPLVIKQARASPIMNRSSQTRLIQVLPPISEFSWFQSPQFKNPLISPKITSKRLQRELQNKTSKITVVLAPPKTKIGKVAKGSIIQCFMNHSERIRLFKSSCIAMTLHPDDNHVFGENQEIFSITIEL